jgi:hypothetical protein
LEIRGGGVGYHLMRFGGKYRERGRKKEGSSERRRKLKIKNKI